MAFIDGVKGGLFSYFASKELHNLHPANAFLDKSIEVSDLFPHFFKGLFHRLLEYSSGVENDREHGKNNQRQFPIHIEHYKNNQAHFKEIGDNHKKPLTEYTRYGFNIVYRACHQTPHGRGVEISHFKMDELLEKSGP